MHFCNKMNSWLTYKRKHLTNIITMDFFNIENVSKSYAAHQALTDVSLSIKKGQVFGLLGPPLMARVCNSCQITYL